MSPPSPEQVFRALTAAVVAGRFDDAAELYAAETDVRHPLAPQIPVLRTREAMRRHFERGAEALAAIENFRAVIRQVHATADPELVVAEFEYLGRARATGAPLSARCIFVTRVRRGLIVESRDYVDHAAFAALRPR